jgi:hypothetical protein
MKHASPSALESLATLLEQLRAMPGLVERTPGAFYYRSSAFVHFHEDPEGLFADVKLDLRLFERCRVSTRAEQSAFLTAVAATLASSALNLQTRGKRTSIS